MNRQNLLSALCLLLMLLGGGIVQAQTPERVQPHMEAVSEDEVRNLILLIGDGMGLAQVSMWRIEQSDEGSTAFDRAQNVALIATHSANNRVTDSAAAGTALACGCKTDNGTLGLTPEGEQVESMIERARRAGRPTGEVVTCALQHATPAAFYAHVSDRDDTEAITTWLMRSGVDLLFGGGAQYVTAAQRAQLQQAGYGLVTTLEEAERCPESKLLGLFADEHLPSALEGRGDYLPRATRLALDRLADEAQRRKSGFLLMVEGSQIDWAGHANDAEALVAEMEDFDRTVAVAMDFADTHPGTLVVVTADHETGGLSIPSNEADFKRSESGLRYAFSTEGHSGTLVPVYLYGAGAERIHGVMDNTALSHALMGLLGLE